jgi:chemotaxis protein CheZ
MSEHGAVHKIPRPSSPPEDGEREYDSIYATMMETAQGRRFLDEFARRHARSDRQADAAAPGQQMQKRGGAPESLDLFLFDVADMAQVIARAKAEIASIKLSSSRPGEIGEATGELHSIVGMTENATSRILAAAEQVQEIAWTLREKGIDDALCKQIDAQASEIYTACSVLELTGQRTGKAVQVLRYLEYRLNGMIECWGKDVFGAQPAGAKLDQPAPADVSAPAAAELQQALQVLLPDEVPQERQENLQETARAELRECAPPEPEAALPAPETAVALEPEARPLAEQEPQHGRQDATLEDIERFMMALDPFAASDQDVEQAAAPHEAPDSPAASVFTERRPQLLIAAILNEATAAPEPKAESAGSVLERRALNAPAPAPQPTTPPEPAEAATTATPMGPAAPSLAVMPPADMGVPGTPAPRQNKAPEQPAPARQPAADSKAVRPREAAKTQEANSAPEAVPASDTTAAVTPEPEQPKPAPEPAAAAEIATTPKPQPGSAPSRELPPVSGMEADEFLFAPERPAPEFNAADAAARASPKPALVAVQPAPKPPGRAAADPLAPLRALSDEEKIALFS